MDSSSGYTKQYDQSLDKDVSRNKLSVAEYYSKKEKMLSSLISGEDSRETCTSGICLQFLYHKATRCIVLIVFYPARLSEFLVI